MKVKELIVALQSMPQELEVYGICDHGQAPEKACIPSIIYTDTDSYTIQDYCLESENEYGYKFKAVLL